MHRLGKMVVIIKESNLEKQIIPKESGRTKINLRICIDELEKIHIIQRFNKVSADSLGKLWNLLSLQWDQEISELQKRTFQRYCSHYRDHRGIIVTNNFIEIHFNILVKLPNSWKCKLKNGPKKNRNNIFYQNEMLSHAEIFFC